MGLKLTRYPFARIEPSHSFRFKFPPEAAPSFLYFQMISDIPLLPLLRASLLPACFLSLVLCLLASSSVDAADSRPPFDKSGRVGKIFSHVNDWKFQTFTQEPMDLDRLLGDSNGSIEQDFAYNAHKMEEFGISGIYLQNNLGIAPLDAVLEAFRKADNGRTVALFATRPPNASLNPGAGVEANAEAIARGWIEELRPLNEVMRNHPNYDRVDGYPVIVCYGGAPAPRAEWWAAAVQRVESELGRFVWLRSNHFWDEKSLEEWIPHLDGITQYSTHGVSFTRFHEVAEPMHERWSGKIFEANAGVTHQSVIQGSVGRDWGYGTEFLRFTLEYALGLRPDTLHITNWNDVEENSHIAPSYIRWDSLLRIIRARTREFRGLGEPERVEAELIVTNKIDLILGQMLDIEVLGLPMAPGSKPVTLDLRLSDDAGREIHRFPPRAVRYDKLHAEQFRVQSADLGEGMPPAAVYPVLFYEQDGQRHGPYRLRPTRLRLGQTPTDLAWMTPLSAWRPDFAASWAVALPGTRVDWKSLKSGGSAGDATTLGEVLFVSPGDPRPVFVYRTIAPAEQGLPTETRLLLNGTGLSDFPRRQSHEGGTTTWFKRSHDAPNTWLEIETFEYKYRKYSFGSEVLHVREPSSLWVSLPIHLARDLSETALVRVPVPLMPEDDAYGRITENPRMRWESLDYRMNEVRELSVPLSRIPVFHYGFDFGTGEMVLDQSGYDHHGWMGDQRTRTGHMGDGPFGFNFEHFFSKFDQPVGAAEELTPEAPERRHEPGIGGFLRFDGDDDYVYFHARTDIPFVSTIELTLRPAPTGRKMVVLSTLPLQENGDQRMTIGIDGDGRLIVDSPVDTQVYAGEPQTLRSESRLSDDKWSRVAIVNDGREIRAYMDGERVRGSIPAPSWGLWNSKNFLFLGGEKIDNNPFRKGSKREFEWDHRYKGDVGDLRITGRPLDPSEFLYAQPR